MVKVILILLTVSGLFLVGCSNIEQGPPSSEDFMVSLSMDEDSGNIKIGKSVNVTAQLINNSDQPHVITHDVQLITISIGPEEGPAISEYISRFMELEYTLNPGEAFPTGEKATLTTTPAQYEGRNQIIGTALFKVKDKEYRIESDPLFITVVK
jgi:hypothetical protein